MNKQFRTGDTINPPEGTLHWLAWAFFGNDKDGLIGDKNWNPERLDTFGVRLRWWMRNPCHNLTWYVLGVAHRNTWRFDERAPEDEGMPGWDRAYSLLATDVAENGEDNAHKRRFWRYVGKGWEFYWGIRGTGAFGVKLRRVR